MDEPSLSKKSPEVLESMYLKRRVTLFAAVIAAMVILALIVVLTIGQTPTLAGEPETDHTPKVKPPPIYETEPAPVVPEVVEIAEPVEEGCELDIPIGTLSYLGCLEPNEALDIFDAEGITYSDRSVRTLIAKIEETCDTDDADGAVDRDCIINTAVRESESSWVCEWTCLEDLASCETYKMHLAVSMLRRYVPATDVFVARTNDFQFMILYKDNTGAWIQPQFVFIRNPVVEAIYNDVYHAGPITETVFPEIMTVEPGDKFCFEVVAPRTCTCKVEVESFTVGDCPQLPADLKGLCDAPVEEVYLIGGKANQLCFEVSDDADEEFYTYKFALTSGEEYIPAGNAFIKQKKWDCCVNNSFEGFLSVE